MICRFFENIAEKKRQKAEVKRYWSTKPESSSRVIYIKDPNVQIPNQPIETEDGRILYPAPMF